MANYATEEPKTTKQKILEAGANLMQSKDPIKSFKQHLVSVAFINGDPNKQFILHHYLNSFNDEFAHALLYDSDGADAKLIGIQYIVSERVFQTMPQEEKKLWHSFHFMVRNGLIVAPSLPSMAEKPLMIHLSSCYGKSFLFWDTKLYPLPYGIPQLMMSFTGEGQANELFLKDILIAANVKMADLLRKREKLPSTIIHEGADSWQRGEVFQLKLDRIQGQGMSQGFGQGQMGQQGMSQGFGQGQMGQQGISQGYGQGQMGQQGISQGYGQGQIGQQGISQGYGQGQMGQGYSGTSTPHSAQSQIPGSSAHYGTGLAAGAAGLAAGALGAAGLSGATHQPYGTSSAYSGSQPSSSSTYSGSQPSSLSQGTYSQPYGSPMQSEGGSIGSHQYSSPHGQGSSTYGSQQPGSSSAYSGSQPSSSSTYSGSQPSSSSTYSGSQPSSSSTYSGSQPSSSSTYSGQPGGSSSAYSGSSASPYSTSSAQQGDIFIERKVTTTTYDSTNQPTSVTSSETEYKSSDIKGQ